VKYKVKIEGLTPYMQHRMDDQKLEDWEKNRKHIIERDDINKEDYVRALFHSFMTAENKFYIPAEHIRGALINGGTFLKSKVGVRTKSMKSIVAAMFIVTPEQIYLPEFTEIDKRSAVNKNVKARVIVVRPKWNEWQAEFTLNTGEDTFTEKQLLELLNTTGNYVGIGSFRPTNNGSFGRFKVVEFTPLYGKIIM
jgi:hypothetical protein